jgi:hypothetical protein
MCVMSPGAGTGAGGLHVELCVSNENHRVYSVDFDLFLNYCPCKINSLTILCVDFMSQQ